MPLEIRFSGFGGQGIILAGYITGKAAVLYDHLYATLIQSYGPEARGGVCSAHLTISKEPIIYPYLTQFDILIAMSQEAYTKYYTKVKPNGLIIVDKDLVKFHQLRDDIKYGKIPASHIAEKIGNKVVANMVMLGFFTHLTTEISIEAMQKAIRTSLPKDTEYLNLQAFQKGYDYAKEEFYAQKTEMDGEGGWQSTQF